ncbi:MAG: hypothetical protein LBU67_07955, partial [Oscillospiraceae bacterium]|nr:hypothetical protein [Oscillospiraceae bacterium]
FPRKLETLRAVISVFAEAYNRFGKEKQRWRAAHTRGEVPLLCTRFSLDELLSTPLQFISFVSFGFNVYEKLIKKV